MREYEKEAEEPSLAGFLERVALVADVDGYDPDRGAVSLMTVHTAKGLEFPWVFLTGLEENVFPHARSIDDEVAVEEERRLCYVAVTRAMRRLFVTRVRRRRLSGQELPGMPEPLPARSPEDIVENITQPRPAYLTARTEGTGPWAGRWNRDVYLPDRVDPRTSARAAARPVRPAEPGQIRVEYDEDAGGGGDDDDGSSDSMGLRIGGRLRHAQFGVGEVRGWQSVGADLKVTMRFPQVGIKTILARFLTRA